MTAYAPTNAHCFDERQTFFHDLADFAATQRTHGPTIVLGDFNARLHYRNPGEHCELGPAVFGNPRKTLDVLTNRELLLELCRSLDGMIANTCFDKPDEQLVTYRNLGVQPASNVCYQDFAQIDFVLVPRSWLPAVADIQSDRGVALQSQHFVLMVDLCLEIEKLNLGPPKFKQDLLALN